MEVEDGWEDGGGWSENSFSHTHPKKPQKMFVSALQFLQKSSAAPAAQQHAIIGSAIGAFSVAGYATWYSIQHDVS